MSQPQKTISPFPETPIERPCWYCRKWIKLGQQMVRYDWGPDFLKTYHQECDKQRKKNS